MWLPGITRMAPFAAVLSDSATQAVMTSAGSRPQYVESWCHDTKLGLRGSLMKNDDAPAQDVRADHVLHRVEDKRVAD